MDNYQVYHHQIPTLISSKVTYLGINISVFEPVTEIVSLGNTLRNILKQRCYHLPLSPADLNTTSVATRCLQKISRFLVMNVNTLCVALIYWNLASYPDSKVHGANMGPIWGLQDPGGPHVGPINFAIWVFNEIKSVWHFVKQCKNSGGIIVYQNNTPQCNKTSTK